MGVVLHGLGHEGVFGGGGGKLCERGLRAEGEVARLQEEKVARLQEEKVARLQEEN